ncbi:Zinc finger FYVE domain-containing protein 9 [Portunus trituberculatus]|uniref:Zinc finger FYVE domain-containing protein 9 n=1 Tax=Portunus trituberculatus TaxID=210409 RepID=A0A5B7D271_PORTR|nr:Zinc finger FYVE domain-containing protein 9 [Portunus trituberculatus]
MMAKLRDALQNMRDFDIPCGPTSAPQPDEMVVIRWTSDDKNFNVGIKSPVDEKQMDGVPSVKIHSGTDYISNSHLIRWTEVFILQGETNNTADINLSRLSELLARSFCVALTPHLSELYTTGHTRLGLRTTLHQDNVGYEAGSGGARLAPACMNDLDNELVPVIHRAASNITQQPIILELVFHIMEHGENGPMNHSCGQPLVAHVLVSLEKSDEFCATFQWPVHGVLHATLTPQGGPQNLTTASPGTYWTQKMSTAPRGCLSLEEDSFHTTQCCMMDTRLSDEQTNIMLMPVVKQNYQIRLSAWWSDHLVLGCGWMTHRPAITNKIHQAVSSCEWD